MSANILNIFLLKSLIYIFFKWADKTIALTYKEYQTVIKGGKNHKKIKIYNQLCQILKEIHYL